MNYYQIGGSFGVKIRPDSSWQRARKLWGRRNHHWHQTTLAIHPLGVKTFILLRGVDASMGECLCVGGGGEAGMGMDRPPVKWGPLAQA